MKKKISLSKLETFLKARCDDLRTAGLDATEYRDYIIAMIFLKRVNDTFAKEQIAHKAKLHREYPELTEEELNEEIEQVNADAYEFYVPLKARWKIDIKPRSIFTKLSQQYNDAKAKLEDGRIKGVERDKWQKKFDEAEDILNWKGLVAVKSNVGDALTIALKELEQSNSQSLNGVLSSTKFNEVNTKGEKKIPDATLIQLINDFNSIALTDDNFEFPDLLGAAYEYLLKYFAESAGKKGGEFYTPAPVVELMGKILKPAKNAEICDPTVGSGGLLINMRNYVESRYGDSRDLTLYGQELIDHTYKMCKMNMIFHGIKDARIEQGDTLLTPKLVKSGALCTFDIVVANPPFSQNYTKSGMKFPERFRHFMPVKKKADFMFVQHMVATLKADGRMAVVMPHGVLFRAGEEAAYRKELINGDNGCLLECVIGLPEALFYGTSIPASILIINKKDAKNRPGVLFINADREYAEGKNQNSLRPEDVEKISYVYGQKCEIPKYSRMVTREELASEEYNCNIRRYVDNSPDAEPQDVEAHLHGGIPVAEISALKEMFDPWGKVEETVFEPLRNGYKKFKDSVTGKDTIKTLLADSKGVKASVKAYQGMVDTFWTAVEGELKALPQNRDVFKLSESLTKAFTEEFLKCNHPVMDEFQIRGAFAQYLSELRSDLKSVASSAWNAELIPDEEILASQFPDVLTTLRELESRKDELQAKFDAVADLGEDDEWDADEYEVMPKAEIKRVKGEIKESKGEHKQVEKRLKEIAKIIKAHNKHHEEPPPEVLTEKTQLEASLGPIDVNIAALEAQIAKHVELENELKKCNQDIREIEKRKDELVEQAREQIPAEDACALIMNRWHNLLASTIAGYIEAQLRKVVAAIENLYNKYTITLGSLISERDQAAEKLDGFLKELGYGAIA